jgi:hypothetical protein
MYRFETNDGCATCDAMEGLYEEPPDRPHLYCRCIIYVVDDADTDFTAHFDRTGEGWSWSYGGPTYGSDEDGDGYGEHFRMPGALSVECCDGRRRATTMTLSSTGTRAGRRVRRRRMRFSRPRSGKRKSG